MCSRLFSRFYAERLIFVQFVLHSSQLTHRALFSMRYNFMDRSVGHPHFVMLNSMKISVCVCVCVCDGNVYD